MAAAKRSRSSARGATIRKASGWTPSRRAANGWYHAAVSPPAAQQLPCLAYRQYLRVTASSGAAHTVHRQWQSNLRDPRHLGRRSVTLTGAGGDGKTRLAIEVAIQMTDDFPDGSVYVDLAPIAQRQHGNRRQTCPALADLDVQAFCNKHYGGAPAKRVGSSNPYWTCGNDAGGGTGGNGW
jgi:hypothetical protein